MAKLSELYRLAGNYLELHGNKEITSIGTCNGSSDIEYILNFHDIFDGPIGMNPYRGSDKLNIPKKSRNVHINREGRAAMSVTVKEAKKRIEDLNLVYDNAI